MPEEVYTKVMTAKPWGTNLVIDIGHCHEVHHAHILKGGYSSRHRHLSKHNVFYVVEGELRVRFFDGPSGPERIGVVLQAGTSLRAAPGEWHQFEAVTDVHLIEVYWLDHVDPGDIDRADVGGRTTRETAHEGTKKDTP